MEIEVKLIDDSVKCKAFNGILGECADLFEQRMPFFHVWEDAWMFTTLVIEVEAERIRYSGKYVSARGIRNSIFGLAELTRFDVSYSTKTLTEQTIAEMFNKRIMHMPITERGCYDLLTNTWGGK